MHNREKGLRGKAYGRKRFSRDFFKTTKLDEFTNLADQLWSADVSGCEPMKRQLWKRRLDKRMSKKLKHFITEHVWILPLHLM